MSETVLNAAGTSAAGTVTGAPTRTINLKFFGYLYIFFGIALLVFGNLFLEYPKAYKGVYTPTASLNTTAVAIVSILGILYAVLGYLDYRNVKSRSNKIYYAAILFILGLPLIPLFTDYGAFNGILASNAYNLSGISMGGLLVVFAALGEMYLLRKQKQT
jgi:magnesium-transporting ATPase (P-type)